MANIATPANPQPPRLAYIGLGNIGLPVARNLSAYQSYGKLRVWNRTQEKYNLIPEAEGLQSISDLFADVIGGYLVIFTSFADDEVALEMYDVLFKGASKVAGECKVIFVDQSTLSPDTSAGSTSSGTHYLASPVIGQPAAAASRQLVSCIAGDLAAIKYVKPILDFIGRATIIVGENVAQASRMKLFVNMMLYESIQVFSEVYALADATGFPGDKLHEVFQTVIPAPPLVNYSNKISKGLFDGSKGFKIDGGLKDIQHVLSMAEGLPHHLPLPTLQRVQASLRQVKLLPQGGGAEMSVEAISGITVMQGGMEPFKEGTDFGSGPHHYE